MNITTFKPCLRTNFLRKFFTTKSSAGIYKRPHLTDQRSPSCKWRAIRDRPDKRLLQICTKRLLCVRENPHVIIEFTRCLALLSLPLKCQSPKHKLIKRFYRKKRTLLYQRKLIFRSTGFQIFLCGFFLTKSHFTAPRSAA